MPSLASLIASRDRSSPSSSARGERGSELPYDQLKDTEAVFTITGRSGPGAHGLYFDYGTERWFGFAERACADNEWLRNIRRKTSPFLVDMMNRGEVDVGVRIQDMARLVDRARGRPVN